MKKLCILIISLFLLTGCNNTTYHWEFTHESSDIVKIKIVDASDDFAYSVIKELDVGYAVDLYNDIKMLELKRYGTNLLHPSGLCFMIVFSNGEYDIISQKEPKHYRYDGEELLAYNSWLFFDESEFSALIAEYLAP